MTMMILQLSTKYGCTSYHLVPKSFVNDGTSQTRTQHGGNAGSITYLNQPSQKQGWREDTTTQTCDRLIINKQTIDFRLGWVRRCLTHLVLDEDLDQRLSRDKSHDGFTVEHGCKGTTAWSNFENDRARLKKILDIYSIILKQFPSNIELPINRYVTTNSRPKRTQVSLLEARQRVLDLIERLGGYCDSIDSLRCILKARHIQGVIYAYDMILKRFGIQNADQGLFNHASIRNHENHHRGL